MPAELAFRFSGFAQGENYRKGRATDIKLKNKGMSDKKESDKEFLEYIVKALVDHPDDVKIERKVDEMGVLLSLRVNAEDMGQIVGRQGSTARAIRSLVRLVGLKNRARVNLKIEEPEGGRVVREKAAPAAESAGAETEKKEEDLDDLKL